MRSITQLSLILSLAVAALSLGGCGGAASKVFHGPHDECKVSGTIAPRSGYVDEPVEVNGSYDTEGCVNLSGYNWSVASGPGAGTFDDPILSRHTQVTFDTAGTYTLRFEVRWWDSEGDFHTTSWNGTVVIEEMPDANG
jgi:hypothetical protein